MARKKDAELPPLFFCDNCGAEVSQDETACPKCGRHFASIRCPACSFSGEEKLFQKGCPKCGYNVLGGAASKYANAKRRAAQSAGSVIPKWLSIFIVSLFALGISLALFYLSK